MEKHQNWIGDFFGGFTAMLVALPSAIAFGILIYSPFGDSFSSLGILSGLLGTIAIGLIAPIFGGSPRLISAPCAPAAAVLSAFAIELSKMGIPTGTWPLALTLVALGAGGFQILFGFLKGGRLIKYIPYPVVTGYLSGVGALIFIGQVPKILGIAKGQAVSDALLDPNLWSQPALIIGGATIAVMILATRVTRILPAPVLALTAGLISYWALVRFFPHLATLESNTLVVGPIQTGTNFSAFLLERWGEFGGLGIETWKKIFTTALTLAVLLSIDTLKTCVILDALTGARHESNKELIAQGLGNLSSSVIGGMPGAGTMGATLISLSSGARTSRSGVIEGALALVVFVLFRSQIAWLPIPALAAILLVVGVRMIDWKSFELLKRKTTILDFVVIAAVVVTAVGWNLMAAAGVGLALAILLFVREQIRGSVVRRKALGNRMFSKRRRLPDEMTILESKGEATVIFELQGSLFFGTTDQLHTELDAYLKTARYIILNLRRIQSVDFTAVHLLSQIEVRVAEHGGLLILTGVPTSLPSGQNLLKYFDQVGLVRPKRNVKVMNELDDALEWVENLLIEEAHAPGVQVSEQSLELSEIALFKGLPEQDIKQLRDHFTEKSFEPGQKIFQIAESGDELFLIRKGIVKITVPIGSHHHHLATFSQGDFFGDMSFLDSGKRSADAVAASHVELYTISRSRFDFVTRETPKLGEVLFGQIARVLALRLRQTDLELRSLEET